MHRASFSLEITLPNLVDPLEQISDFSLLHLNQLKDCDRAAHDWYRFVLSFPPHLVQDYLERFGITADQCVLDPFCGTGTTVVDAKRLGIASVGVEANPMAHFAGSVKLDWSPNPDQLMQQAERIAERAIREIERGGEWRSLPEESAKIILKNSISPLPLHKALILKEQILAEQSGYERHLLLAFARAIVTDISNLRFGPEVGVISKLKPDAPVVEAWLARVTAMAEDLRYLQTLPDAPATIHHADSRQLLQVLEPTSIDAVITSPPYPNEKDYTRTTRLESVLLGFLNNKAELRALKQGSMLRSNTRNVYKADLDDQWVSKHAGIQQIAQAIEDRRIELGKTSGFEKLYHRAAKHYFGGMAKHLADLRQSLRPNAQLAYVVGDQKSYLQVMIYTGNLLAEIAEGLGYEVVRIDLFRTRLATSLKEQIREEVVVLRWSGKMPAIAYPFSDRPL